MTLSDFPEEAFALPEADVWLPQPLINPIAMIAASDAAHFFFSLFFIGVTSVSYRGTKKEALHVQALLCVFQNQF